MTYTIRPARAEDYSAIIDLYQEHRVDSFNQPERLRDNLTTNPAFVAEMDEKLVGFIYTFTFAPDIIEMQNIYVAKALRGQNIGQDLIKTLHANLKEKGYAGVVLSNSTLYETKSPARFAERFYVGCGYQQIAATAGTRIYFAAL